MTGLQTLVSSGGSFSNLNGLAIETTGDIVVTDVAAFGGSGGIIRVDPVTGFQTTVSSGGFFVDPRGIAIVGTVPEPSTGLLLALSLVGLLRLRQPYSLER